MIMSRPSVRYFLRPMLLLLAALVLSACATIEHASRVEKLERTIRAYSKALQRAQYEQAALIAGISASKQDLEKLRTVTVTSYQEQGSQVAPDLSEANAVARIEFTLENTIRVRSVDDIQQWRYEEATGRWVLLSGFPNFFGAR